MLECIKIYNNFNGKLKFKKKLEKDLYYKNFMLGNTFRQNCYRCKYAQRNRVGDITLGDFWGLNKNSNLSKDEKYGISLVLCNSKKGSILINNILKNVEYEERPIEEAINGNSQLRHPTSCTKNHDVFINNYTKVGYKKSMKKALPFKEKVKYSIKGNKFFYSIINIIKK